MVLRVIRPGANLAGQRGELHGTNPGVHHRREHSNGAFSGMRRLPGDGRHERRLLLLS